MGFETLIETTRDLLRPLVSLFGEVNLPKIAATVGVSILLVVALAYAIYGFTKLSRMLWNLKVRSLTLGLILVGVLLVVVAAVLPG